MRQTILDAARRLAEDKGAEGLTLGAVAAAAGIARGTLYGYFTGKQDLLSQLAGGAPQQRPETPAHISHVEAAAVDTAAADISVEEPKVPDSAPAEPADLSYDDLLRQQAAELDQIAKRVIVPKSAMGTDAAIARLESRLRTAEQNNADAEARLVPQVKDAVAQAASALELVYQLQKRTESSDNRVQLALAELRLELHNLAAGIDPTKTLAPRVVLNDAFAAPEPVQPAPERVEPRCEQGTLHAYLTSARRAAVQAATDRPEAVAKQNRRWPFALVMTALLFAVVGYYVWSDSAARQSASASVPHASASGPVTRREVPADRRLAALAESGNARAELVLGVKLLDDNGGDPGKAAIWIERAAEDGEPAAQARLGALYLNGTGVSRDPKKALVWFEAAAKAGNVRAMADLGKLYAGGRPAEFAKAASWFKQAALLDDIDSQFNLAVLYESGRGVARNLAEAYKWYAIAAAQGDLAAAARARTVADRLPVAARTSADAARGRFQAGTVNRQANDLPSLTTVLGARS